VLQQVTTKFFNEGVDKKNKYKNRKAIWVEYIFEG